MNFNFTLFQFYFSFTENLSRLTQLEAEHEQFYEQISNSQKVEDLSR